MSAPGNTIISTGLGVLMLIILCYVGGRLHQWYRHTLDREDAYRDGYNTATKSLFHLATRVGREVSIARNGNVRVFEPGVARGAAPVPPPVDNKPVILEASKGPRHRAGARRRAALSVTKQYEFPDLRDKKSA